MDGRIAKTPTLIKGLFLAMILTGLMTGSCTSKSGSSSEPNQEPPTAQPIACSFVPTQKIISSERKGVGIVLTAFNRPEYLRITLESLKFSNLPAGTSLVIADDASTDPSTLKMIDSYSLPGIDVIKIRHEKNMGLVQALLGGWNALADIGVDFLVNIDPDVYVKKDWINTLQTSFEDMADPNGILTGFNAPTHGIGACRETSASGVKICRKDSMGGVNFFFTAEFYRQNLRGWLQEIDRVVGWKEWDWKVIGCMKQHSLAMYTTTPSVLQHLGARGTNSVYDGPFDFAEDF